MVGSTTHEEFKHIEKDRALARRLQKITIDEPSIPETVKILKGLQSRYEAHHRVRYTDEAIEVAAKLNEIHTKEAIRVDAVLEKFGVGAEPPVPESRPRERERQFLHALVDVLMDSELGMPIVPAAKPMRGVRGNDAQLASLKEPAADEGGPSEPAVLPLEPYATSVRSVPSSRRFVVSHGVTRGR